MQELLERVVEAHGDWRARSGKKRSAPRSRRVALPQYLT